MRLAETGQLIGDIGIHFTANDPRQVEIGFTVSPAYQGRGFGAEAVLGMRQEAHFRESPWFKGEWADDMVFGILEAGWRAR